MEARTPTTPHRYVLLQICGEIDDAYAALENAWFRYTTETDPLIRRFHIENFLKQAARLEEKMRELVERTA